MDQGTRGPHALYTIRVSWVLPPRLYTVKVNRGHIIGYICIDYFLYPTVSERGGSTQRVNE